MTAAAGSVLIVDDEEPIRRVLDRMLTKAGYRCTLAADVAEGRALLERSTYSVVLSDVNMPGESGIALVELLRRRHPDTAVVMVTGVDDPAAAEPVLQLGAHGYVVKPFEANEILINVANAVRRRDLEIENRQHRERLELRVAERTARLESVVAQLREVEQALRESHTEAIERLALAAEFRDPFTGEHLNRMSRYSRLLAEALALPRERADVIELASMLHDIGKIAIPDEVLLKPGKFTPEEFAVMQEHPEIGTRMLAGSASDLLRLGAEIAYTHHERWDGGGYPRGLRGTEIPLEGRVVAIADVFDALTSARPYKPAFDIDRSVAIIREGRGSHFDPELVDVFLDRAGDFAAIAQEGALPDPTEPSP